MDIGAISVREMTVRRKGDRMHTHTRQLAFLGAFRTMRTHSLSIRLAIAGVVAVAVLAGGCTSSQLVNMWKDPEHPQKPIEKVYVIGLKKDEARRRLIEDAFVAELTRVELTAIPSYRDFATSLPDTQQVTDIVKRDGFDGVLVVIPQGVETRETYVPGYVSTYPTAYYGGYGYGPYGYWGGYYQPAYATVYQPGYIERDDIVRIRIDVWSIDKNGMMVWTGTTESINPASTEQLRKEVIQLVVPELRRMKVIETK